MKLRLLWNISVLDNITWTLSERAWESKSVFVCVQVLASHMLFNTLLCILLLFFQLINCFSYQNSWMAMWIIDCIDIDRKFLFFTAIIIKFWSKLKLHKHFCKFLHEKTLTVFKNLNLKSAVFENKDKQNINLVNKQ